MDTILAVPNLSEGRDFARLDRFRASLESMPGVRLLDWSADVDHNRSVFTVAGDSVRLGEAMVSLALLARSEIAIGEWTGLHPAVGALDVAPFVWLDDASREIARDAALSAARAIGEAGIPAFLYGELASTDERRARSYFRRGGIEALWTRMSGGGLRPDFGPDNPDPNAGAVLVSARPPLAAFNIEFEGGRDGLAREVAERIRESAGGPTGLRAIGLELSTGRSQVSMNVEDPVQLPLAEVVSLVSGLVVEGGGLPVEAELIGLVPEAAMVGYPADLPIRGFDPEHHLIERRLRV